VGAVIPLVEVPSAAEPGDDLLGLEMGAGLGGVVGCLGLVGVGP